MNLQFAFDVLVFIATVGAGLMAGVYFTFSAFIMRSLDTLTNKEAVGAMNAINIVIVKSWFLPLFFATTLLYVFLAVFVAALGSDQQSGSVFVAAIIYIVGMFLTTLFFNIPLNNELATANSDFDKRWSQYLTHWLRWNHVRTLSCIVTHVLGLRYFIGAM